MILIHVLTSLLIPTLMGYAIYGRLFRKSPAQSDVLLGLSLSYGLGLGLLTYWMLFLDAVGFNHSLLKIGFPLLFFTTFLLLLKKRLSLDSRPPDGHSPVPGSLRLNLEQRIICLSLLLIIVYYTAFVFWQALNFPIYVWDAIATSSFKAKIFYYEGGIPPLRLLPNASYPLLVELSQTWIAINLGEWHDQWVNVIFPAAFLAYLIIHYRFLEFFTDRFWAMIGTALIVSSHMFVSFATVAYRDFFMLYYNGSAIMLLLWWQRTRHTGYLILASLFSGFMTFTKSEGSGYLAIHLVLLCVMLMTRQDATLRRKFKDLLIFLVPACSLFLFYFILRSSLLPTRVVFQINAAEFLPHFKNILDLLAATLFMSGHWNILWFVLLISYCNLPAHRFRPETAYLTIGLALFFGLYIFLNLFTSAYDLMIVGFGRRIDLPRAILHFFPLVPLLITLLNYPCPANKKGTR